MKVLSLVLFAVWLTVSPAQAEHPWAQFFDGTYPIERNGQSERVELGEGVVVSRHPSSNGGGWGYTAADWSDHGAAGCVALFLVEFEAFNRACPDGLDASEKSRLSHLLERAAAFYAANAVPPVSRAQFFARIEEILEDDVKTSEACTILERGIGSLARGFLSEAASVSVARTFDTPRLPVEDPCF